MADTKETEEARKKVHADAEARKKASEEYHKTHDGTPTPTQEENDLAKLGHPPESLAKDGSAEDPSGQGFTTKDLQGSRAAGYETRQAQPHEAAAAPPQTRARSTPHSS